MRFLWILIISSQILFAQVSFASEFKCPDHIETQQSLSSPTENGWAAYDDSYNGIKNLENMAVFDGNPKGGASLVPDNEQSDKDPFWTTSGSQGLWVECIYRQTTIRLVQSIPNVKKCTLKYKRLSAKVKTIDKLVCQ